MRSYSKRVSHVTFFLKCESLNSYTTLRCSNVQLNWRRGFHDLAVSDSLNVERMKGVPIDSDLLMIHCHHLDFNECERRHNIRLDSNNNALTEAAQLTVGDALKQDFDVLLKASVEIPQEYRDVFC